MNDMMTVTHPNTAGDFYSPNQWVPYQPVYIPIAPVVFYPTVWNVIQPEDTTVLKARIFDLETEIAELKRQVKELQSRP